MDNITEKELTILSEFLTLADNACKNARLYSKELLDPSVYETISEVADGHETRFSTLLKLL